MKQHDYVLRAWVDGSARVGVCVCVLKGKEKKIKGMGRSKCIQL